MKVQAFRRTRVSHLTVSSEMWAAGSWRAPGSSRSGLTVVDCSDGGHMLLRRWGSRCPPSLLRRLGSRCPPSLLVRRWGSRCPPSLLLRRWGSGCPPSLLVGGEVALPLQTAVWGFLRLSNSKVTTWPSSPTPRCISKRSGNTCSCRDSKAMFLTGIIKQQGYHVTQQSHT